MNLGQLLEKILPIQVEGIATGGSTSTVVDSDLVGKYDTDAFKDGLVFIHSTTDGLAPVNEFSIATAYADSTGTFSVSPSLTTAVGAGDYYSIADPQFRKAPAIRIVNETLRDFGIISLTDTSLTASANTLEYTLPLALKAWPLDKVEIGNTTDGFEEVNDWYVVPATAGSQAKLVFNSQPRYDGTTASNQTLRIWYRDYHPVVDTYDDKIAETIPEARAVKECKFALQKYIMERDSDFSKESLQKLGMFQQDLVDARTNHRVNVPDKKLSKFIDIGRM